MSAAALSPWILARDADGLLAFLAEVLGAREVGRVPHPDGSIGHAETLVGGVAVVVAEARPGWPTAPQLVRVRVDDLDGVLQRALAAGARLVTPRTSLPQGEDAARFTDPWDNLWWVHEQVEEVRVEVLLARLEDPTTLTLVQGFEGSLDEEMRRRART